jgi:hypothetical protein
MIDTSDSDGFRNMKFPLQKNKKQALEASSTLSSCEGGGRTASGHLTAFCKGSAQYRHVEFA